MCKLVLILIGTLLLSGCQHQETAVVSDAKAVPAYGDTLIMGTIADASNLLPVLSSDSASSEVSGLIYNGLVRYDKDLKIVGELAKSWDITADKRTITFHLRHGVKWHDGVPFTAADVLFTYKTYIDPHTPTAYAEQFKQVSKAEVLDPYTFRVTYRRTMATALITWGVSILPKHLLEGKDITKSPLSRAPIGTGPYKFVEWDPGQKIVLEANPDYFEGEPYIHRIVFRIIPDPSTMFLELQSGGLDYMDLTPLQYARQTDSSGFRRRFSKYRYLAFAYTYLGYNLRRPLFQDKRVRQAIAYAINKKELIDGVLFGLGEEATGPYKPGTWPYDPHVKHYPYDPAKAKALLAAAGWKDTDGDGILDKDGHPFSFTIVTNQGNDQRIMTGEIIQRRLHEVGIDVKLRVIEWASFLKDFINPGNFDATILGWTIPIDPDAYNVWDSSKTKPGELNFIGFKNAEVDKLLDEGRSTLDRAKRKKIYDRFQEILAEEQPYTFLYVPDALPVVAARVHGIKPAPAGIMYNFNRWFVPKSEQKYLQ